MMIFFLLLLTLPISVVFSSTECVWATGKLVCKKNPKGVLNATVTLFDLDGPAKGKQIYDHIDPDDKMGFTIVDRLDGLFNVEGCADDFDWIPGVKNRPEIYIRVHHYCNTPHGEYLKVMPTFRVFVPQTYDYHMEHPIVLD
ncbi:unnamed protein product [Enterobius vermicularis]|uniref:Transthyretin-like family protein n=1 Tax=Enterobius vermicularis TaxID=51028 RepID=A0A0N4UW28_ENTVE|nr:unnamed protein product [Enterobius vermicularis]